VIGKDKLFRDKRLKWFRSFGASSKKLRAGGMRYDADGEDGQAK